MPDPVVLYEVDDKVSVISLNRPEKLNAISAELQHQLPMRSLGPMRMRQRASSCCAPKAAAFAPAMTSWRGSRGRMTGAAIRRERTII